MIESVDRTDEIKHPAIRGALEFMRLESPRFAFHHDADLPAQSGLGSSAAFTVGFLKGLYAQLGIHVTKKRLALDAISVDQDYAGDVCGVQDQIASAYGGINHMTFGPGQRDCFNVQPLLIDERFWLPRFMLFYTRQQRRSGDIEKAKQARDQSLILRSQGELVEPCLKALYDCDDHALAELVSQSWELKREMAPEVRTSELDEAIERAYGAGALGVKACGAGAGGSIFLIVDPEARSFVREALSDLVYIPIKIDHHGSQIVYHEQDELAEEMEQAVG